MKIAVTCIVFALLLTSGLAVAKDKQEPANVPAQKAGPQSKFMLRHEAFNAIAKKGGVDLVFLGDSITQQWEDVGKEVWDKYYGKRRPAMMGISGDRTQHLLWRIANGNLDGISPKVAVIMIGTNNTTRPEYSVDDVSLGIAAVVKAVRAKSPRTKILLLGIFPRGPTATDELRLKNVAINKNIAKLHDDKNVFFLDIGRAFLAADGTLSKEISKDFLHLSPKGYALWAEAMEPKLAQLMK